MPFLQLRYSDGITWHDCPESGGSWNGEAYGLLGDAIEEVAFSEGSVRVALSHVTAGAPYVRVGVQVADANTSSQVEARLSMSLTPCSAGGGVPLAVGLATTSSYPTSGQIGPIFSAVDVDQITLLADWTKDQSADTLGLKVQTANEPDPTANWITVTGSPQISLGGASPATDMDSLDKDVLGTWVRVVVDTASLTGDGTLNLIATLRMR